MVVYEPTMTTAQPTKTMTAQPTKPDPAEAPAGLVWVKCPHAVVAFELKRTLEAAGYTCCAQQQAPVGKSPSFVLYCPSGEEDVASGVKGLRGQASDAPVLVMGLHADPQLAREALLAEADGFVHAGMQHSRIASAVASAVKGDIVLPRELLAYLVEGEKPANLSALGPRQREILELVAEGLTNAQIAKRLFLSEGTVKQHLYKAYKVLGVRNRSEARSFFGRALKAEHYRAARHRPTLSPKITVGR